MSDTSIPLCDYDTGTAGSGPSKCGRAALFVWVDPDGAERLVCRTHARSVRAKFLPGGGTLTPIAPEVPTVDDAAAQMALDALRQRHERQIRNAAERIQEHVGHILKRLDKDSAGSVGHYAAGIATDAHEMVASIAALDGQAEVLGVLHPAAS